MAVASVADRTGGHAVEDAAGRVTVFAETATLVEGDRASSLAVDADTSGAMRVRLNQPGGSVVDITANVDNGALGGLRQARDVDLARHAGALDQFAYDLATAVNAVHAAGVGLDGVSGRALFAPPAAGSRARRA